MSDSQIFAYPRNDVMAGVVVFLVALPLCLGIAVACGVPPVSGLIAGIIGGLVVPFISRSPLSVTGPAAGLTSIVIAEVNNIGLAGFLTAVALAGVLQIGFGALRAGRFSSLVPGAVVKGMLAAIGIIIVMKQLPVAAGVATLGELGGAHAGAVAIAALGYAILWGWPRTPLRKVTWLPPALVVVVVATALGQLLQGTAWALAPSMFVSVPTGGVSALFSALPRPDPTVVFEAEVWVVALTIAVVASMETLLSVQAVDQLDPLYRRSPPDRELIAQGVANLAAGLVGALPVTAVIVRSGANVAAGGRERLSAIVHGVLLLVAVVLLGHWMNLIPLPALAAVLISVGFGLCRAELVRSQWRLGWDQFLPFALTVAAILATDLLEGVMIGVVVGVVFVLMQNTRGVVNAQRVEGGWHLRFRRDATWVAKPAIAEALAQVQPGERVIIDGTGEYVDHDVKEQLAAFRLDALRRQIQVDLVHIDLTGAGTGGH